MALTSAVMWAFLSGTGIAMLGIALLLLAGKGRTVFSAFCLLWGIQIMVGNAGRAAEPDVTLAGALYLIQLAFIPPTTIFLVHFVASRRKGTAWFRSLFLATALAGGGVLALAPGALYQGIALGPRFVNQYTPLAFALIFAPFTLAFVASVLVLVREYASSRGAVRQQSRLLLSGFLLFTSYGSIFGLRQLATRPPTAPPGAPWEWALYIAWVAVVLGVVAWVVKQRRPLGLDTLLFGSAILPMAIALAETFLAVAGLRGIETLGLWRVATVAAVAYAIARYQLFDLDVRLRGSSTRGAPFLAGALVGAATVTALEDLGWAAAFGSGLVTGVLSGGLSWHFRRQLGEALFPRGTDDPEHLAFRRREVYEASLERVLAEGTIAPEDERLLRALRRKLGITDEEHVALEAAARARAGAGSAVAPGMVVRGKYRVDQLLGEGSFGRAYLAWDLQDEAPVVIKVVASAALGGQAKGWLQREARLLRALDHPNVVRVFDAFEEGAETLLVMEYVAGGDLQRAMQRRGRLPLGEASRLLDDMLAGLEAAHAKGIVHRDVKPANILLALDGQAKLADFGIARELGVPSGLTEGPVGTLLYMAPEQVRGQPADARSDLYAAAVVFHQAATGKYYLQVAGKDDFEIRQLILERRPRLELRGQPAWVGELLRRALAEDPAERFASAAEMRAAIPAPKPASHARARRRPSAA